MEKLGVSIDETVDETDDWCFYISIRGPRQQKQRQTTCVWSRKRDSLRYFCQTPNCRENSIGLIAVMCVGGAVISSSVISQLLWWTREHKTVAVREALRSTPISWYGDGGDVSFDLAVTAREETQLADDLTCKSQHLLPAQFNTFTLLHQDLCWGEALLYVLTFKQCVEKYNHLILFIFIDSSNKSVDLIHR